MGDSVSDVDPLERLSALQKIVGRLATASDDDLDAISEALNAHRARYLDEDDAA
jgi:hypothetical protein